MPTDDEIKAFRARKGVKKKRGGRTPADLIDFSGVTVHDENEDTIRYRVPLREDISHFFSSEKLVVEVTVEKKTSSIEHVSVGLRAPMSVALGLARVADVKFEIDFPLSDAAPAPEPAYTQPEGKATATLVKFGTRSDFEWSDFERVK